MSSKVVLITDPLILSTVKQPDQYKMRFLDSDVYAGLFDLHHHSLSLRVVWGPERNPCLYVKHVTCVCVCVCVCACVRACMRACVCVCV